MYMQFFRSMPPNRFGLNTEGSVDVRHLQQCVLHQRYYVQFLENRLANLKGRRLSEEGNSQAVLNKLRKQLRDEEESLRWLESYSPTQP